MSTPKKYLPLISLLLALIAIGLAVSLVISYRHASKLKNKIHELESQQSSQGQSSAGAQQIAGPGVASSPADRIIKDLSTRFIGDARSISEKLHDFLKENPDFQSLAIACKVVADMSDNQQALSDQELDWLYQQESKPEFKRVVAQVLSLRGDNKLLDSYVVQYQTELTSSNPEARSKALAELAKTRYAGAAKFVIPVLDEKDPSIVQEALLALRATGNESNIQKVKGLVNSSDESVSWLAKDTLNTLEMLSKKARTRLISADIAAELPPITDQ